MLFNFPTLDSGQREQFVTGAQRDAAEDKPRFGLIPISPLTRVAALFTRGAQKYDDNNWRKGMPYSRTLDSLLRHAYAWAGGDRAEDHLAAVVFNAMALMQYEEDILLGRLSPAMADLPYRLAEATPAATPSDSMVGGGSADLLRAMLEGEKARADYREASKK